LYYIYTTESTVKTQTSLKRLESSKKLTNSVHTFIFEKKMNAAILAANRLEWHMKSKHSSPYYTPLPII